MSKKSRVGKPPNYESPPLKCGYCGYTWDEEVDPHKQRGMILMPKARRGEVLMCAPGDTMSGMLAQLTCAEVLRRRSDTLKKQLEAHLEKAGW